MVLLLGVPWGPDSAGAELASVAMLRRLSCCCCCCWWRVGKVPWVVAGRGSGWCVLTAGLLSNTGTPETSCTKLMNLRGHHVQQCTASRVKNHQLGGCASAVLTAGSSTQPHLSTRWASSDVSLLHRKSWTPAAK